MDFTRAKPHRDVCETVRAVYASTLSTKAEERGVEVIGMDTNPPFRLAEEFIVKGLDVARRGVAVLVRTVFLESVGRYERIFSSTPPSKVAQFVERVPMVKGRLDKKASTATGYAWVVWEKGCNRGSELLWVPPCRKSLEHLSDYDEEFSSGVDEDAQIVRENERNLLI
jgi:hypothetical protein